MFVVEVGAALTTLFLIRDLFTHGADIAFQVQISLWLWFTVLFANFAEAMAEARGKAQADTLRKTKTDSMAKRIWAKTKSKLFPPPNCVPGISSLPKSAKSSPVMAKSSMASPRWTNPSSPAKAPR